MSKYYSTKEQRIKWLLSNQRPWEGVGSSVSDKITTTIREMKQAGLYSHNARINALHTSVYNLIQEARNYRRLNQNVKD